MSKWGNKDAAEVPIGEISTLLGKDAEVKGAIKTQGSMRIDGTVEGELASAKTITIGSTGVVQGDITAENIIISGKVTGTLTARSRIILESTARLEGDINASRLAIAEGASFRGRSNTGENAKSGTFGESSTSRIKNPPATQDTTAGA